MKKLTTLLAAIAFISVSAGNVVAGEYAIGVSGSMAMVEIDGTETLKDTNLKTSKKHREDVVIPAIFAEYTFDVVNGITVGMEYVPAEAELGSNSRSDFDVQTGNVTVAPLGNGTGVTQKVAAELEDHTTLYVEVHGATGGFLTAGIVQADVITQESLGTGATYGNVSLDGTTFGAGWKGDLPVPGMFYKVSANYTNYDEIRITGLADNASQSSIVNANLDHTSAKLALGYKF
ncbi:MAG: hypothetical protein ACJZ4O_02740 [Pelagibacteraceae bacterium]